MSSTVTAKQIYSYDVLSVKISAIRGCPRCF